MEEGERLQVARDRVEIVRALILLPPLQRHELIREQRLAGRDESGIFRFGVTGIVRVALVPTSVAVVSDEIDRPVGSVGICFAHYSADAAHVERARRLPVEGEHQQPPVRSDVKSHALMHHRRIALRQLVDWKDYRGLAPYAAVFRSDYQRLPWRDVLP